MQNKLWTISNSLIFIACIFTAISFIYPGILIFGMNSFFYIQGNYTQWFLQMFTSQFLHGGAIHLLMNSFFVLYFGNVLERLIGEKKMLLFFLSTSLFLGFSLTFFTSANTIGMSGFAMALLSYYTLELYSRGNPEYTGGITALVINVGIGFTPGISLIGHLGGAVFGLLFYIAFNNKINGLKR